MANVQQGGGCAQRVGRASIFPPLQLPCALHVVLVGVYMVCTPPLPVSGTCPSGGSAGLAAGVESLYNSLSLSEKNTIVDNLVVPCKETDCCSVDVRRCVQA